MKIRNFLILIPVMFMCACSAEKIPEKEHSGTEIALEYAEQFKIYENSDGAYEIDIADGQRFLVIPEGEKMPENTDRIVIQQPVCNMYVSASSAVDLFDGAGALDSVKMTSTKIEDWKIPAVAEAIEDGKMLYVGKYNAPDYEMILSEGCGLAVESTMIYHSPETKEKLESLDIPVMVERSSYETHPLGRLEWIKLYGILTGHEKQANDFFNEKIEIFRDISIENSTERPKVAFFYITANGSANVRKSGDYISKMIELAGAEYIFTAEDLNADENALSTMNMDMETFYEKARDADIIIYNSTVEGELENISQLTEKSDLLRDFKAVQEGNVWRTGQNMFQQTTGMCDMIRDINMVVTGNADNENLTFLQRLE